ncbi:WYL domain-containing protein, partial [bacterium]|nr:WYL domain-containing protein [bacterium]
MASNKNATIRYRVLDRCLSNHGRYYTIDDLIEECNIALQEDNPDTTGISRRTIFNDIKYM